MPLPETLRRGDRVADCAALEMLCTGNSTAGSNPALSAITVYTGSSRFGGQSENERAEVRVGFQLSILVTGAKGRTD